MKCLLFSLAILIPMSLQAQIRQGPDQASGGGTVTRPQPEFKFKIKGTGTVGNNDRSLGAGTVTNPKVPRTGTVTSTDRASGSGTVN